MVRAAWGSEYAWGGRYTGRPAILNFALVLRRQVEELQVEGVEFVAAGLVPAHTGPTRATSGASCRRGALTNNQIASVKPAEEPYHEDDWDRDAYQPQQETATHHNSPCNLN